MSVLPHQTRWGPVLALALGAAAFVTSELLPASLIGPMASGLGVSEGMAGQSMSVTALAAIFGSLFATTLIGQIDRRVIALICTALVGMAAVIVGLAQSYPLMLAGRALFGLTAGVFWAMSSTLVLRLVRPEDLARALSLIFGAVPVAMIVTVSAGGLLGEILGWRGVFLLAAALAVLCFGVQLLSLPPLPPSRGGTVAAVWRLRRRPGLFRAMLALGLIFAGKFTLFPYARPYLEREAGLGIAEIALLLLGYGLANLLGTALSSLAIARNLRLTLSLPPLAVALCVLGLLALPQVSPMAALCMALWGFSIGLIPVAWSTWTAREVSDDTENAGCLQFSTIQIAIATGVAVGGLALDLGGPRLPFLLGAVLLCAGSAVIFLRLRER